MTRLASLCAVAAALLLPLSACGSDSSDSDASASFTAIPSTTESAQTDSSPAHSAETPTEEEATTKTTDVRNSEGDPQAIAAADQVCGEVQGTDGSSVEVRAIQDGTSCDIGILTMAYYIMAINEGRTEGSAATWMSEDGWYCLRDEGERICSAADITGTPAARGSGAVKAVQAAG